MKTLIIGASSEMRQIYNVIEKVAPYSATILLTGESGVGKNLFAYMAHDLSPRKDNALITVNCGAIPNNLLESELFGYERGAFTGAKQNGKIGIIETADRGTLFLDEIGDLPLILQGKLLKVIQEKKLVRVGGVKERAVDFRLISATNANLETLVARGSFRKDLFYRLNVVTVVIPPLRERKEDIDLFVNHFADKFNSKYGLSRFFTNDAINRLKSYPWPGNVRELENVVERMILMAENDEISSKMISSELFSGIPLHKYITENRKLKDILAEVEKEIICNSYKKHGTTTMVAKELGISQASVSIKLKKYLE